jgi:hypothetical protein
MVWGFFPLDHTYKSGAKSIWEVVSGYKNNKFKTSGGYIWKYKK